LRSKLILSHRETSKQVSIQNLFQCCVTVFGLLGRVSSLSPLGGRVQGWRRPLDLYNQPPPLSLGFGFCLDYSVKNSFAAASVCETPTREINHSSAIWLHSFLFLLVFFDLQAKESAFLARSTVHQRSITRGDVVLRLRGFRTELFGSRIELCRDSTKSRVIRTFRKIRNPSSHQVVIRASGLPSGSPLS
jgi:hypothetical protein